jgi:hypothetical protein
MSYFLYVQHETFDVDDIESNSTINTSIKDMQNQLLYQTADEQDINLLVRLLPTIEGTIYQRCESNH